MTAPAKQNRSLFKFGDIVATRLGLVIPKGLAYAEWQHALEQIVAIGDASAWMLGDILAYCEWNYGDKYRAIVDELEVAYHSARDYAYVAGNVPAAVRRPDLSWAHHRVVAKLVPAEQEIWLARAVDERWTFRELRDAIAEERGLPAASNHEVLEQLRFVVPPERLQLWQAAAERAHAGTVTDWATAILDAEAARAK